jgi:IS4 transposase
MDFKDALHYIEQFIGMEVSEAFKADIAGILVRDPYGSKSGVSESNRNGRHISVIVGDDAKFKYKAMLTVDRTNGYYPEDVVSVIRGYRVEKVLNLKELKKYSVKELNNEKN